MEYRIAIIWCNNGLDGRGSSTHNVDELGEAQSHFDSEAIAVVANGADEAVVVGQQVVVETLRFRIGRGTRKRGNKTGNGRRHRQQSAQPRPPSPPAFPTVVRPSIPKHRTPCPPLKIITISLSVLDHTFDHLIYMYILVACYRYPTILFILLHLIT